MTIKHVNDAGSNLMAKSSEKSSAILTDGQVEKIHNTLTKNIGGRGFEMHEYDAIVTNNKLVVNVIQP